MWTVVGTLGGILAGAFGTWFIEKARWKHEDRIRWHPDPARLEAEL